MPLSRLLLAAALPLFAGCATLSESDCGQGDWFGIGEADARAGHTPDRLARHDEACTRYGVRPDPRGYQAGFAQGLVAFCVPAEAFSLGRRGGSYYRQCGPEIERDFLPAYALGSDVHAIDQDLIRIEIEIDHLRDEVKDEKNSPETRAAAEHQLGYVKDERDRRRHDRDQLLARARDYGYGNVW
jgi:hypothetical protein